MKACRTFCGGVCCPAIRECLQQPSSIALIHELHFCANHQDLSCTQGGDIASFQHRLKHLQASFLATSTRISSEMLASRMQCGLPGFGPALVAASAFLQQLLWTAVWLQSMAAFSCQTRGKKGKKSAPQVVLRLCTIRSYCCSQQPQLFSYALELSQERHSAILSYAQEWNKSWTCPIMHRERGTALWKVIAWIRTSHTPAKPKKRMRQHNNEQQSKYSCLHGVTP